MPAMKCGSGVGTETRIGAQVIGHGQDDVLGAAEAAGAATGAR